LSGKGCDVSQSVKDWVWWELLAARAWPAFESIDYDGWELRFAGGYTKRANSVNPHFGSSLPVAAKIAHCEALYEQRGLPTIFRLTPFSQPPDLDTILADAGYESFDHSLVMATAMDRASHFATSSVSPVSEDAWFEAFDQLRGLEPIQRAVHRRIVESSDGERYPVVSLRGGKACACGLGVLVGDVACLFDLFTADAHRRQGHGAAVVASILEWASSHGARRGLLQVERENTPARRLYERLGFTVAYPYWYRMRENR
jgi:GNAT superfamily N-acetyltransferase